MVNETPKKQNKTKQKMLVSQILDNFDIDENSLHGNMKDGH